MSKRIQFKINKNMDLDSLIQFSLDLSKVLIDESFRDDRNYIIS